MKKLKLLSTGVIVSAIMLQGILPVYANIQNSNILKNTENNISINTSIEERETIFFKTTYEVNGNNICGISPNTTIDEFIVRFVTNAGKIAIYDTEGNETQDLNKKIETSMKLELKRRNCDTIVYNLVVEGDEVEEKETIFFKSYINPVENGYLYDIVPNTTLYDFIQTFATNADKITVYDVEGNETEDLDSFIKTSMKIKLQKRGYEDEIINLVVRGDLDGNGIVDISDLIYIREAIQNGTIDDTLKGAADINDDGNVDISDLIMVRRHIQQIELIK